MRCMCAVAAGMCAIVWLTGCGGSQPAATGANSTQSVVTAKAPQQGGSPLSQTQQGMAIDQVVEKSAAQVDTGAGRRAQSSIDKISAQKKNDADEVMGK